MTNIKERQSNYHLIYQTVKQIPEGKVATYGEIAKLCGLDNLARIVGYALRSLPLDTDVPWHRVVNRYGNISFPESTYNYKRQKELLLAEGIVFRNRLYHQIDLEKYGWMRQLEKLYKRR